jgi:hypothetical protein
MDKNLIQKIIDYISYLSTDDTSYKKLIDEVEGRADEYLLKIMRKYLG